MAFEQRMHLFDQFSAIGHVIMDTQPLTGAVTVYTSVKSDFQL